MRIAVTGRSGQIASALAERGPLRGHEIIPLARPVLDLALPETILPAIAAARPDIVVSAGAYTAVDKAESEADLAYAINGAGAGRIAQAAHHLGIPVIHLSTDYVFDGAKADSYLETDVTNPLGVYGQSKLLGERLVAEAVDKHVIMRVAWVYSPFGSNFVKTMLRLAESRDNINVVADQRGGPTSALDIADAILSVAEKAAATPTPDLFGIFHFPPAGEASWADFAEAIFQSAARRGRKPCQVTRITTAEYPTPARRPMNSRLSGTKAARLYGIGLPAWPQSLETCLDRLI